MLAQEVMTTDMATVRPDAALADAVALMLDRHVSGLPVVDGDGALVGILTEGDLLRRAETGTEETRAHWVDFLMGPGRQAAAYTRTHSRLVADLMTDTVVTAAPETPLRELVDLMERHRVRRLPVLRDGALVGLVSRADLLRALAGALAEAARPRTATDAEIHAAIIAEFERQSWAPLDGVTVHVDEGVVMLEGTIFDNRDRAAMLTVARNIPGVKSVQDDLTWVEPVTGASLGPAV